jgi:hypothetical protein
LTYADFTDKARLPSQLPVDTAARFDPPLAGPGQGAASLSQPVARGISEPVARGMSQPVARGMSEPVARGIWQLNHAATHAAGSWALKSPTSGPNHTPAIVPLAATFALLKALAKNSARKFELAVVEICALPLIPVFPARRLT